MKSSWKNKDWNPDIPIETRFRQLLKDWKKQNQIIGELKSYIEELEYKIRESV